ncbi:MAG: DUF4296 domain-containing protein [Lishizhenia sp.]
MRLLIGLLFLTLFGCQPKLEKVKKPANLVAKDKFALVLEEMMLLEAHLQSKYENVTKYYNLIQNSAKQIFIKYDIDSAAFSNSMDYYGQKQEILKEIYIEVQNNVNQKRMEVENK